MRQGEVPSTRTTSPTLSGICPCRAVGQHFGLQSIGASRQDIGPLRAAITHHEYEGRLSRSMIARAGTTTRPLSRVASSRTSAYIPGRRPRCHEPGSTPVPRGALSTRGSTVAMRPCTGWSCRGRHQRLASGLDEREVVFEDRGVDAEIFQVNQLPDFLPAFSRSPGEMRRSSSVPSNGAEMTARSARTSRGRAAHAPLQRRNAPRRFATVRR